MRRLKKLKFEKARLEREIVSINILECSFTCSKMIRDHESVIEVKVSLVVNQNRYDSKLTGKFKWKI